MFKTRIIPISAGTPQELAYAERTIRTIAEKSRAMLLGAPHLPNSMWGLADLNAAYVHDILPQSDCSNKSPYFMRTNASDKTMGEELQGVHSVKVLRDHSINQSMNEALPPPPITTSQPANQGGNVYEPDKILDEDSLQEKIKELKQQAKESGES
jgi:hypothetical protein